MVYSTLPEQDSDGAPFAGGREVTSTLYRANATHHGRGLLPAAPAPDTGEHHRGIHGLLLPGGDTTYYFNPHFTWWVMGGP